MIDRFLVFGHLLQLALDKLSRYLDIEYCVTLFAVMTIAIFNEQDWFLHHVKNNTQRSHYFDLIACLIA